MDFELILGGHIKNIPFELPPFSIDNNDDTLLLNEGDEPEEYYIAKDGSFEIHIDHKGLIQSVFLFPTDSGNFQFRNFSTGTGKSALLKEFGEPSFSRKAFKTIISGHSGGFDRFDRNIVYHFEYADEQQSRLKRITLMTLARAPKL